MHGFLACLVAFLAGAWDMVACPVGLRAGALGECQDALVLLCTAWDTSFGWATVAEVEVSVPRTVLAGGCIHFRETLLLVRFRPCIALCGFAINCLCDLALEFRSRMQMSLVPRCEWRGSETPVRSDSSLEQVVRSDSNMEQVVRSDSNLEQAQMKMTRFSVKHPIDL